MSTSLLAPAPGATFSSGDETRNVRLQGAEGEIDGNRKRQRDGGDSAVTGERRQTLACYLFEILHCRLSTA